MFYYNKCGIFDRIHYDNAFRFFCRYNAIVILIISFYNKKFSRYEIPPMLTKCNVSVFGRFFLARVPDSDAEA